MLSLFPTDISLHILSFLSLYELRSLLLVSHGFHHLIAENEATVYHQAAVLHKFVSIRSTLEDVLLAESHRCGWLEGVQSWKEMCCRWIKLERNWDGQGVVHEGGYKNTEDGVLHFKIDEEQKTIVAVWRSGGLTVRAMEDNRVLWSLSKDYLFRARCELSSGFLVFSSSHHGIEIWRRAADVKMGRSASEESISTPIREPSPAAALEFQFKAAELAAPASSCGDFLQQLRGQYTPHAYLGQPLVDHARVFSLRFPMLALMSIQDRNSVLIFDVRNGELLKRVSFEILRPVGAPHGFEFPSVSDRVVMDVDVTENHVSICLHSAVFIVPWRVSVENSDEQPHAMVLAEVESPQTLQDAAMQLRKVVPLDHRPHHSGCPIEENVACVAGVDAVEQLEIVPPSDAVHAAYSQALVPVTAQRVPPCFVSARLSPDGRHLAAVTVFGLLYLIPNFTRVERGAISFSEIARRIYMGEWLRDLVWDNHQQRRLAVKAASEDIFVVNLDPFFHFPHDATPSSDSDPFANTRIFRLCDFSNPTLGWARERGVAFNGVQMTRTAVWMVWDLALLDDAVRKREPRRRQLREWEDNEADLPNTAPGNGSLCFVSFAPGI